MCGTENFFFNNSAVKSLIQFWTGRLIFCKIRGHRSSKLIITCMASDVYCMHCRVDDSKEICYPKFSKNPKNFIVPPETETSVPWKSHFVWKMVVSSGDVIWSFPEKVGHRHRVITVIEVHIYAHAQCRNLEKSTPATKQSRLCWSYWCMGMGKVKVQYTAYLTS